jgi:hypothetical protein
MKIDGKTLIVITVLTLAAFLILAKVAGAF